MAAFIIGHSIGPLQGLLPDESALVFGSRWLIMHLLGQRLAAQIFPESRVLERFGIEIPRLVSQASQSWRLSPFSFPYLYRAFLGQLGA